MDSANDPTARAAERPNPIPNLLDQFDQLAEELDREVEQLRSALSPVLRRVDGPEDSCAPMVAEDRMALSPVAERLHYLSSRLANRLADLRDLRDRLEV